MSAVCNGAAKTHINILNKIQKLSLFIASRKQAWWLRCFMLLSNTRTHTQ